MKRLFGFFSGGGILVGTVAAAGLAGLLVLMSCSEEEAGEEREKVGRVLSVKCGPPEEGEGAHDVDLYYLTESEHGVLNCTGLIMVLTQEGNKAFMRPNLRNPEGVLVPLNISPYVQEGYRAQNRHGDGTCGRRIYTFTHHLQTAGAIRSPGVYYVEEHPDVEDKDGEDKDEWIGFWVGTPDQFDAQTNEGLVCPTYMKMDPDNRNTPNPASNSFVIPCTEEVRTKMNGRDFCLLVNNLGFPENRTLRLDWDAVLAPPESQ